MVSFFKFLGIAGLGAGISLILMALQRDEFVGVLGFDPLRNAVIFHEQMLWFLSGAFALISGIIALGFGSILSIIDPEDDE